MDEYPENSFVGHTCALDRFSTKNYRPNQFPTEDRGVAYYISNHYPIKIIVHHNPYIIISVTNKTFPTSDSFQPVTSFLLPLPPLSYSIPTLFYKDALII